MVTLTENQKQAYMKIIDQAGLSRGAYKATKSLLNHPSLPYNELYAKLCSRTGVDIAKLKEIAIDPAEFAEIITSHKSELTALKEENARNKDSLKYLEQLEKDKRYEKDRADILAKRVAELESKHGIAEIKIDHESGVLKTRLEDKSKAESYCEEQLVGLDPQILREE